MGYLFCPKLSNSDYQSAYFGQSQQSLQVYSDEQSIRYHVSFYKLFEKTHGNERYLQNFLDIKTHFFSSNRMYCLRARKWLKSNILRTIRFKFDKNRNSEGEMTDSMHCNSNNLIGKALLSLLMTS